MATLYLAQQLSFLGRLDAPRNFIYLLNFSYFSEYIGISYQVFEMLFPQFTSNFLNNNR